MYWFFVSSTTHWKKNRSFFFHFLQLYKMTVQTSSLRGWGGWVIASIVTKFKKKTHLNETNSIKFSLPKIIVAFSELFQDKPQMHMFCKFFRFCVCIKMRPLMYNSWTNTDKNGLICSPCSWCWFCQDHEAGCWIEICSITHDTGRCSLNNGI